MKLAWSETAKADYLNLLSYIAAESPASASIVQGRIERAVALLADFRLGTPGPRPGTFKFYIPKTSYFAVYRILPDDTVLLLALIHSSRDWMRAN